MGTIKLKLLEGTYNSSPVRRVEIPKSNGVMRLLGIPKSNGVMRLLGIPTVIDRMIQQAIAQKLTKIYEPSFLDNSFGFRPNRSVQDAIKKVKVYVNQGNKWVVDMDLEKFFDKVKRLVHYYETLC